MDLTEAARDTAERLLADSLPQRWRHVRAVGAKAERAAVILPVEQQDLLVAAAWLHDVGYSPGLVQTGFHPLDGARWLREQGLTDRLSGLVAHHSCASFEAAERGLADELLAEFPPVESEAADVLWWADMTTGPDGQDLDVTERLFEIRERYGPDHLVTRFWSRAEPSIVSVVRRVEQQLTSAGQPIYGSAWP